MARYGGQILIGEIVDATLYLEVLKDKQCSSRENWPISSRSQA
jgi:hypothetical protein